MKQRGRKSAASLTVVQALPQRPAAPAELTGEQRTEWEAIVRSLPADWVQRENHPLLAAYCRHIVSARTVARMLDAVTPADVEATGGLKRFDKLASMAARESAALSMLATKLRLSVSSRIRPETAGTRSRPSGRRPWETDEPA